MNNIFLSLERSFNTSRDKNHIIHSSLGACLSEEKICAISASNTTARKWEKGHVVYESY